MDGLQQRQELSGLGDRDKLYGPRQDGSRAGKQRCFRNSSDVDRKSVGEWTAAATDKSLRVNNSGSAYQMKGPKIVTLQEVANGRLDWV